MAQLPDDVIEIRVPCKPEYVRTVRRTIAEFAESISMPKSAVAEVEIAASEAVANIVRHAYANSSCRIPPVRVRCFRSNGSLTVEVIDKGCGFAAPPAGVVPEIDMSKDGGMGIVLMELLMDRVNYVSKPAGGTRIRMTKSARQVFRSAARLRTARLKKGQG